MMIELSKIERKILKHIAINGYKTYYDLSIKDRVAAVSTVWKTLKKLEKLGLVEVKREEQFQRIPSKGKRFYGLTFRGLMYALKIDDIKLYLIKNKDKLINSWFQKMKKIDEFLKLRRFLGLKKADLKKFEDLTLNYIRENPERVEEFLRHFDINFSSDLLIYVELIAFLSRQYFTYN